MIDASLVCISCSFMAHALDVPYLRTTCHCQQLPKPTWISDAVALHQIHAPSATQ
ncbi:unnamed protein product, partial [Musa acuminata subsp. malaccensis]